MPSMISVRCGRSRVSATTKSTRRQTPINRRSPPTLRTISRRINKRGSGSIALAFACTGWACSKERGSPPSHGRKTRPIRRSRSDQHQEARSTSTVDDDQPAVRDNPASGPTMAPMRPMPGPGRKSRSSARSGRNRPTARCAFCAPGTEPRAKDEAAMAPAIQKRQPEAHEYRRQKERGLRDGPKRSINGP